MGVFCFFKMCFTGSYKAEMHLKSFPYSFGVFNGFGILGEGMKSQGYGWAFVRVCVGGEGGNSAHLEYMKPRGMQ